MSSKKNKQHPGCFWHSDPKGSIIGTVTQKDLLLGQWPKRMTYTFK